MTQPPPQFAAAYHYEAGQKGVATVRASAHVIVPLLNQIFHPTSVVDLGCGTGDWLSVWSETAGCSIRGFDGKWVPQDSLCIPSQAFNEADFCAHVPDLGASDLAMCLEVAEHVPPNIGTQFVAALCNSSNVVVWSAAVPGQGGYGHVNEQYQDYWVSMFANHGYIPFDLVRPKIWMHPSVSWWYQQNLLVFLSPTARQKFNLTPEPTAFSIVHPSLYEQNRDPKNYSFRKMLPNFPFYVSKGLNFIRAKTGMSRQP
jgi:hypothetical protein